MVGVESWRWTNLREKKKREGWKWDCRIEIEEKVDRRLQRGGDDQNRQAEKQGESQTHEEGKKEEERGKRKKSSKKREKKKKKQREKQIKRRGKKKKTEDEREKMQPTPALEALDCSCRKIECRLFF